MADIYISRIVKNAPLSQRIRVYVQNALHSISKMLPRNWPNCYRVAQEMIEQYHINKAIRQAEQTERAIDFDVIERLERLKL